MLAIAPTNGHNLSIGYRDQRVWHALYVRGLREQDAADWLKHQGIPVYWPNYTTHIGKAQIRHGRRTRSPRFSSVIPGMLFSASVPGADPREVVQDTPGVFGYMRDGAGYPAKIDERDIETIRRIEAGLNLPPPTRAMHSFKISDKVRFIDDLLGRWPAGKIIKLAKDGGISVEVPLLGRAVPIWVVPHQIEAM